MKKVLILLAVVLCALCVCIAVSACNGGNSANYNNLKSQYDSIKKQNEKNQSKLTWLENFNSIEPGSSYSDVKALIGFDYLSCSGSSSEGAHEMIAYEWNNRSCSALRTKTKIKLLLCFATSCDI